MIVGTPKSLEALMRSIVLMGTDWRLVVADEVRIDAAVLLAYRVNQKIADTKLESESTSTTAEATHMSITIPPIFEVLAHLQTYVK